MLKEQLIIDGIFNQALLNEASGDYFYYLLQYRDAEFSYSASIQAYSHYLQDHPGHIPSLNNQGFMLLRLAETKLALGKKNKAYPLLLKSLDNLDRCINEDKNDTSALNNKGMTLMALGEISFGQSEYEEAFDYYLNSIDILEKFTTREETNLEVLVNLGRSWLHLGNVQLKASKSNDAYHSVKKSINIYQKILLINPLFNSTWMNYGSALMCKGQIEHSLEHEDFIKSYKKAISTYQIQIDKDPGLLHAYIAKAEAQNELGEIFLSRSSIKEAIKFFSEAVITYKELLSFETECLPALNALGMLLFDQLSRLYLQTENYPESLNACSEAIDHFNNAIEINPDYIYARKNRALATLLLGELQARMNLINQSINSMNLLLNRIKDVLKIDPTDQQMQSIYEFLQSKIDTLEE